MSEPTVSKNQVVILDYVLADAEGNLLDTTRGRGPLAYLHGHNNLLQGLEDALEGHGIGADVEVSLAAAQAYGVHNGQAPQSVPKREIPKNVPLQPGQAFTVRNAKGEAVRLWIKEVRGGRVLIDTNHPLAGKDLRFQVQVLAIRTATDNELAHGHAHGPSGVSHH